MPKGGHLSRVLLEFIVYALGGAAQRAAFLVLVPVLGQMLSSDDFGRWALFIALIPMLAAIIDFGFSKALGRFYFDYDDDPATVAAFLKRAIALRVVTYAALAVPLLALLYLGWPLLTGSLLPAGLMAPLVIAGCAETVILATTVFCRVRHLVAPYAALRLGQALLTLLGPLLLVGVYGLQGAVAGLMLANLIMAAGGMLWLLWWIARQTPLDHPPARFADAGPMIRYGAPVVVHDLSWWIRNSSSLVILGHFVTAAMVGAYSIGFAALSAISMLCWSLDIATAPYYYKWRKSGADWAANTRNLMRLMNGLLFSVCSVAILSFAHLRELFFAGRYQAADDVAPLLICAGMLQPLYFLSIKPYFYLKRTALLSRITFTTSAIVVLGTIVATWQFGYVAAAAMTVLSYASVSLISYRLSLRLEDAPFGIGKALLPSLTCGVIAAFVLMVKPALWLSIAVTLPVAAGAVWLLVLPSLRDLQRSNAFRA